MLTAGIVVLGPVSGGGFNPVRGLAPDVLAGAYPAVWIYVAGPLLGAALAAGAFAAARRRPVTGKVFHDPAFVCHLRCDVHPTMSTASAQTAAAHLGRDHDGETRSAS
jgi:aquaporin Z